MKTSLIAGSLAVALVACTSFDPVQRGTCGNGLLEPGEDCDSKDPSCVRCAVVCTQGGSATQCPTSDYTCGVDGFCHAPGGALAPPIALGAFQVDDYAITDVDHDQIGDVLGLSKSSLVVRHGDVTGNLSLIESTLTPVQTGNPTLADLDLDGSLDVTIATPDGLVAYTSPFGTLSPAIASITLGPNLMDVRMAFSITPFAFGMFVVDQGHVALVVADFGSAAGFAASLPCGAVLAPAELNVSMIDSYQVSRDGDPAADAVVALVTGTGPAAKLCVMAIHKDNLLALATITNITPATPPVLKRRPVFADLDNDGDRCPDLVTSEAGGQALRHYNGIMGVGHCTLKASVTPDGDLLPPIPGSVASIGAVGHATIDPPALGSTPDALVMTDGVYAFSGTTFTSIYQSTRRLSLAVSADLDNDGLSDTVLAAEGQDDLDVLYRLPGFAAFQLFRIDTASEVTTITLDDFDGNGIKDIAYTERLSDHQRMMLVYSTTDHPLPPVEVATFADVTNVARTHFAASYDPYFRIADLMVLQRGMSSTLTVLYGSPQRTMISYIDPRSQTAKDSQIFRGAMVGRFAGTKYPDLVGIAPPSSRSVTPTIRGWLLPSSSKGIDASANNGFTVTGLSDCSRVTGSTLCVEDSVFAALPASPTKDVALGIDHASPPHVAIVDASTFGSGTIAATPVSALSVSAGNVVHTLLVEDVDGDHVKDLVAAFTPASRTSPAKGMVLVCQLSNGVPQTCTDLVPLIISAAPATKACLDVAVGHVGYRNPNTAANPTKDLLVLCRDDASSLYRVYHAANAFRVELLEHAAGQWSSVRSGDVTGDGVDDIVILDGDRGSRSLIVYPQCTSSEATRCNLSGVPRSSP